MKVLIADDHPLFLEAISGLVARAIPDGTIRTADCLTGLLQQVKVDPPNLVLADYSMPGIAGPEDVRSLCAVCASIPVIMMSGVAREEEVRLLMQMGARAFIPKTLSPNDFGTILSLVLRGGAFSPALVQASAPVSIPSIKPELEAPLTPKEIAVLEGIIAGKSNKLIARDLGLQEITVKLHARRIFQKMGVRNRAEAAAMAVRHGLLPPG